MNTLSENMTKGTFGELLVQLRLLQYGVQAAPPIKDSGNDLIAVRGEIFRAIQVKTRSMEKVYLDDLPKLYHILAIVRLDPNGKGTEISLDNCIVYLMSREEFEAEDPSNIEEFRMNEHRINILFPQIEETFHAVAL